MRSPFFALVPLLLCQCQAQPVEANLGTPKQVAHTYEVKQAPKSASNILMQSEDGGETWLDATADLPEGVEIGRMVTQSGNVYLSTNNTIYRRSTSPLAAGWQSSMFLSGNISNLFTGIDGPYMSCYGEALYQIAGNNLFMPMSQNLPDKQIRAVHETQSGHLLVGCETGLYKTTDRGATWKHVLDSVGVNTLAQSGDALLCATFEGIFRSTDGGENWENVSKNIGSAYRLRGFEGGAITMGEEITRNNTRKSSIQLSTDAGKTWKRIDETLPSIRNLYDVERTEKYIFCATDQGIFRTADQGKTWKLVHTFLKDERNSINLSTWGESLFIVPVFGC